MVTNHYCLLIPKKKVLPQNTKLRQFLYEGNDIMTFTTNRVTESVLTKELWRKARIWLDVISSILCHPDGSDFPIVENARVAFVQTTSTLKSIVNFFTKIKAFSDSVSRVNSKGRKYLKYKPKEENICFQTICEKGLKKTGEAELS